MKNDMICRIFEKILSEKNIDAFNGAQGRILYVLWQFAQSGGARKAVPSDRTGRADGYTTPFYLKD